MTQFRDTLLRLTAALCLALALCVPAAKAQGDAMLTQYWALPTYYNPGAAGDTDNLRLRGGGRLQWIGIDNAPKTFVVAADMPFKLFNKKFGVGLVAQQESMGLFHNLSVNAQIGYKLKLFKGELTGSLQIGFLNEQFKGSEVYIPSDDDYHQPDDDAIPNRDVSGNALDLGIGLFYTPRKFWARFFMPTIPPFPSLPKENQAPAHPLFRQATELQKNINSPQSAPLISWQAAIFR